MLIGLVADGPARPRQPATLTEREIFFLSAAGIASSGGAAARYTALRRGKVAVVGPIVSTGPIGATLAVHRRGALSGPALAVLGLIAVGVVMAAIERRSRRPTRRLRR